MICPKCKVSKPATDFPRNKSRAGGIGYVCKVCFKAYIGAYYTHNRKTIALRRKQKRDQNREAWNSRNRDGYYRCKSHVLAKMKEYHALPHIRLARNLRRRLHHALRDNCKAGSAVRDLGCSLNYLRNHLEVQFKSGMTWDNWGAGPGKWNIDHIKPLSLFNLNNRKQLLQACNFKNLRPLWSEDNAGMCGGTQ